MQGEGYTGCQIEVRVPHSNNDLGIKPNPAKKPNSVKTRVSATYPQLVIVRRGSPENGGGAWIHPDLAVYLGTFTKRPTKRLEVLEQKRFTGSQIKLRQQLGNPVRRHD